MPEILAEVDEGVDITATVAATPGSLTDDYNDLQNHPSINGVELEGDKTTNDLHIDHVAYADNLLSPTGTTDTTPYTFRASGGSVAELRKIVGGTLAWNQLADHPLPTSTASGITWTKNSDGSYTVSGTSTAAVTKRMNTYFSANGHVYLFMKTDNQYVKLDVYTSSGSTQKLDTTNYYAILKTDDTWTDVAIFLRVSSNTILGDTGIKIYTMIFDLTQMFGTTIADAIATMETTTAGSGVAFFRSLFPSAYYPYSAATLQSVQTSARQALDGNGNVIRSYPLDDSLTLRGIPKLTNGVLSYDGDIYLPTGSVTRKYGIVDLGTLTWTKTTTSTIDVGYYFYAVVSDMYAGTDRRICGKYPFLLPLGLSNVVAVYGTAIDKFMFAATGATNGLRVYICDSTYTDAATFKTAMSGVYLVYELATSTTETADPYTEVQLAGTTEQFVTTNNIPVGNESFYPTDLTGVVQNLAPLPTTAGTYKLQVTVSGGVPSYSWVAG